MTKILKPGVETKPETKQSNTGGGTPRRLLDRVKDTIRLRHYSLRTAEAYVGWIRRYILFHGKRHPQEMGIAEVNAFLTNLAVDRKVSASTQDQALAALLFLYQQVLDINIGWVEIAVRATRPRRLPVVLTRPEVHEILRRMSGVPQITAGLLYGAGLRLFEAIELRVKDIEFRRNEIVIRDGERAARPDNHVASKSEAGITKTFGKGPSSS